MMDLDENRNPDEEAQIMTGSVKGKKKKNKNKG